MKSIITAMLAAASVIGVASAATNGTNYSYFGDDTGSGTVSFSTTDADVTGGLSTTSGLFWKATQDWSNSTAYDSMIADIGATTTSVPDTYLEAAVATGQSSQNDTLTLTFGDSYAVGDTVTFYITAGSRANSISSLTFTGLTSISVEYATASGTGFSTASVDGTTASASFTSAADEVALIKVSAALSSSTVTVQTGTDRDAYGFFAIVTTAAEVTDPEVTDPTESGGNVPEPATATLSLLALAGLAARRRRK